MRPVVKNNADLPTGCVFAAVGLWLVFALLWLSLIVGGVIFVWKHVL